MPMVAGFAGCAVAVYILTQLTIRGSSRQPVEAAAE
jgi:hypothetical protein